MTKYPVPNLRERDVIVSDEKPMYDINTQRKRTRLRINLTKAEVVFPLFALAAPTIGYIVTVLT